MITVLQNAAQLAGVAPAGLLCKRGPALDDPGLIPEGSVILDGEQIRWVGPTAELPALPEDAQIIDVSGRVVLPGLVDSHTHLVFSGYRVGEFEDRLRGLSYQEISARGGGILSSVRQTRRATDEELRCETRARLNDLLRFGVTTVEIKSGYGLSAADEARLLDVVADLAGEAPQTLVPTFLGAHAVPEEFRDHREDYIHLVCDVMLPQVAASHRAVFCDVFCEMGVFSLEESERILTRARDLDLALKVHADELSPLGGAELAVRLGATSADHLLCLPEAGLAALAISSTVATLLPGTAFFLGLPYAPARRLIEAGAIVALASDYNPGTCPGGNPWLLGAMACTQMRMRPAEVLNAWTLNAAAALNLADRVGSLTPGKQADLLICDVSDYRRLFHDFGANHVERVLVRGRVVYPPDPSQPT